MILLINMEKIPKFFLILGILVLFITGADFSLAISSPSGLTVDCGTREIGDCVLSPTLKWNNVEGAMSYLIHYVQTNEACSAVAEASWREISEHPTLNQYQLTGLSPNQRYCWRVKAEGATEDSGWSIGPDFRTQEITPPSPDGDGEKKGAPIGLVNPLKAKTLEEAINALINFLFFLAMAIVPILIIYAAFLLLTAAGDVAKVNRAKTIILWTLVSAAIILLAKGLPSAIKGILGG